jgi:hypothetical protein
MELSPGNAGPLLLTIGRLRSVAPNCCRSCDRPYGQVPWLLLDKMITVYGDGVSRCRNGSAQRSGADLPKLRGVSLQPQSGSETFAPIRWSGAHAQSRW